MSFILQEKHVTGDNSNYRIVLVPDTVNSRTTSGDGGKIITIRENRIKFTIEHLNADGSVRDTNVFDRINVGLVISNRGYIVGTYDEGFHINGSAEGDSGLEGDFKYKTVPFAPWLTKVMREIEKAILDEVSRNHMVYGIVPKGKRDDDKTRYIESMFRQLIDTDKLGRPVMYVISNSSYRNAEGKTIKLPSPFEFKARVKDKNNPGKTVVINKPVSRNYVKNKTIACSVTLRIGILTFVNKKVGCKLFLAKCVGLARTNPMEDLTHNDVVDKQIENGLIQFMDDDDVEDLDDSSNSSDAETSIDIEVPDDE